ncbi:porin [Idiomarina tyrosinivorans]|uniref:Porin n=1 Tax=Idiomarina tyrosinivorans TaxID=1445662 RepID=A0A432ZTR3_9GAMM|nr:outer membrane beta-barrel protein [Idiomarina tyrosinivorans]RUO81232.1 porin [Idiomarina tyrosinivorans]
MKKSMIALSLMLASGAAAAQSPDWNKVDVTYLDTELSAGGSDASFNGFGVNGSFSFSDHWIAFGNYKTVDKNVNDANLQLDMLSASIGYYHSVTDNTDIFATVSAERLDVSGSSGDLSSSEAENGAGAGIGFRTMLTPSFELGGKVDYLNIDSDNVFRTQVKAFYYFTKHVAIGVGYEMYRPNGVALDIDTLSASFRYAF